MVDHYSPLNQPDTLLSIQIILMHNSTLSKALKPYI